MVFPVAVRTDARSRVGALRTHRKMQVLDHLAELIQCLEVNMGTDVSVRRQQIGGRHSELPKASGRSGFAVAAPKSRGRMSRCPPAATVAPTSCDRTLNLTTPRDCVRPMGRCDDSLNQMADTLRLGNRCRHAGIEIQKIAFDAVAEDHSILRHQRANGQRARTPASRR